MFKMDKNNLLKFYTFVYDLQYSPCGKYLAACDSTGNITIFNLDKVLESSSIGLNHKIINKWKGDSSCVYCMTSNDVMLISGGTGGGVSGWTWKDITTTDKTTSSSIQPHITVNLPVTDDVNDITYEHQRDVLLIACGSRIFCWDITTNKLLNELKGHSNVIYTLCLRPNTSQFATGSEDGTIKLWDSTHSSAHQPIHTLSPNSKAKGWISTVSIDDGGEWLVCGGSAPPTIYKLGSMTPVCTLATPPNMTTQVTSFIEGRILSGGSDKKVYHWEMNGDPVMGVPVSLSHVLALSYNTNHPSYQVNIIILYITLSSTDVGSIW
jgi:THO complex subunit 6